MQKFVAPVVALLAGLSWQGANAASLFVPGSTFQVQAGNSPDTFTDTVNLAAGTGRWTEA